MLGFGVGSLMNVCHQGNWLQKVFPSNDSAILAKIALYHKQRYPHQAIACQNVGFLIMAIAAEVFAHDRASPVDHIFASCFIINNFSVGQTSKSCQYAK